MQRTVMVRLFSDELGVSHFEEVGVSLLPADFAPPAAPLNVAGLFPASDCALVGAPVGWEGDRPHPSPRRQLFCNLAGEYEVTAGDGSRRRFPAGSLLLLEDTTGGGHSTRVLGSEDVLVAAVTLAQ